MYWKCIVILCMACQVKLMWYIFSKTVANSLWRTYKLWETSNTVFSNTMYNQLQGQQSFFRSLIVPQLVNSFSTSYGTQSSLPCWQGPEQIWNTILITFLQHILQKDNLSLIKVHCKSMFMSEITGSRFIRH